MTCSNFSFSLVVVTPTSHFFVFHWLQFTSMYYLFPIGYLPKPTYCVFPGYHFYGWTYLPLFAEFNDVHRTRWYSDNLFVDIIFGRMKLPTISADKITPAGHSGNDPDLICQRYPLCSTPASHINILQKMEGKRRGYF